MQKEKRKQKQKRTVLIPKQNLKWKEEIAEPITYVYVAKYVWLESRESTEYLVGRRLKWDQSSSSKPGCRASETSESLSRTRTSL